MKEILYKSTRSEDGYLNASEAILKGLADDGGLFVPTEIPKLDVSVDALSKMTYQQVAYEVMKLYFTDFTEEAFEKYVRDMENICIKKLWVTEDVRPNRGNERWLNIILQKMNMC